jgi:hypothetical protein
MATAYHDLEGPYASACATQDARDAFFDEHISMRSVAAKCLMELASHFDFDAGGDALFGEMEASLAYDGIEHDECDAADESMNQTLGSGPDKWLAALTRAVEAKKRKDAAERAKAAA